MNSYKRSAFTLIELLTVIAIIALLAAIMFPTFARARENARRTSCSSNLRQIGLGILQYTQDYDEMMPMRSYGASVANLQNVVQPYVKSYQVFICPSNLQSNRVMLDDTSGRSRVSYAPNTRMITEGADNGGLFGWNYSGTANMVPLNSAAISSPSTTIAMCEINGQTSDFIVNRDYFATMSNCRVTASDPNTPCLSSHHLKTSNYLFADGHVKALQPENTLTPLNLWNRNDNAAYTGVDLTNARLIISQSKAYSRG